MKRYIPTVLIHPELTRKELEEAAEKYYFSGTDAGMDAEGIREIYEKLCKAVDCRAACVIEEEKREAAAALTLGGQVDVLQEEYQGQGLLMEAYLTDCLCWELLRKGYAALEERIQEQTGLYAMRYFFPGQNLPLSEMEKIFPLFEGGAPVKLLPGCVLYPSMSNNK